MNIWDLALSQKQVYSFQRKQMDLFKEELWTLRFKSDLGGMYTMDDPDRDALYIPDVTIFNINVFQ